MCCTLSIRILFSNFLLLNLFYNFLFVLSEILCSWANEVTRMKKKPRNFAVRTFSLPSLLLFIYPDPGLRFTSVSVIFPNPFRPYQNTFFSLDISSLLVADSRPLGHNVIVISAHHTSEPLRIFYPLSYSWRLALFPYFVPYFLIDIRCTHFSVSVIEIQLTRHLPRILFLQVPSRRSVMCR